ncbi:hypothetical protein PM082_015600 [Marasmius tenuissimus]|nr:hypothetical protein PM082_015600 [Marasmius tenuissimus]
MDDPVSARTVQRSSICGGAQFSNHKGSITFGPHIRQLNVQNSPSSHSELTKTKRSLRAIALMSSILRVHG